MQEENIEEHVHDGGLNKVFFDRTQKAWIIKEKSS